MASLQIELPEELARAANLVGTDSSHEAARLIALELFREDQVSMGKAAELCGMSVRDFMEFASRHQAPLHYGTSDLDDDRKMAKALKL